MKFEFNGIIKVRQEGDETTLEFIHPSETDRLETVGLKSDDLSDSCRIGSDGDANFYCVDNGCSGEGRSCELRNSGSSWWCTCVGTA